MLYKHKDTTWEFFWTTEICDRKDVSSEAEKEDQNTLHFSGFSL